MGIKYMKFEPTDYVMKMRGGEIIRQGAGLSFLYNTNMTSIAVVPTTAFDTCFYFDDIMTADFQRINVQGEITYVISEYEKAVRMVNFTFDKTRKNYEENLAEAKKKMASRINNLAKIYIAKYVSQIDVRRAVKAGDEIAGILKEALTEDDTIKQFGIDVISVSILGVLPQPDMRKALEAATREEILKQQDDALYKRRNAAIEQERAIKENELNTEIKVAEKEKERREKEMETKRMLQEKQAELDARAIADEIELEMKNKELVELQAENERKKSDIKAYDAAALLRAFEEVDPEVMKVIATCGMDSKALIAKAFAEIGDKADRIGVLNVSPDLLETLTRA